MTALAVRGMAERKLRTALTAIAVLLGVAMIAGAYVQTDRIRTAFEDIERTANEGTDVVISPEESFRNDLAAAAPDTFDATLLERVRDVSGVRQAVGQLQEQGSLVVGGKAVDSGFAPALVISSVGEPFNPMRLTDGRLPERPGEVTIDRQLAEDEDVKIGRRVGLSTRTGVQPVVVSGIAEYGDATSIGGATLVIPLLSDVQRWFDSRRRVSSILVEAQPGVEPIALAARLQETVPRGLQVETGEQRAAAAADETADSIGGFLTPALLALSGAALLVGAFIIFNTFSITVAQRTREFALLRALGTTRRQLLIAVAAEALIVGIVASLLGLVLGLGFAALLGTLFDAAGFGIPSGGLALAPRTVVVALVVGVVVTLLAALAPALRATRVAPVAALQEGAGAPPRRSRSAPWTAAGVSLLGLLLLLQGLFGGGPAVSRLGVLAGGAVLLFVGVALVARYVVRPLAGAIGWPLQRAFHEPGRLARENAMRNPARTATTSAALMVGLGLVVFVAVFAAGLKSSISGSLDDLIRADAIVTAKGFQPLPQGAQAALMDVPGVRAAVPQYFDRIEVDGRKVNAITDVLDGVDASRLLSVYRPEWVGSGSDELVGRVRADAALVEEQFAKAHGIEVGERFRIETSAGRRATLTAIGEYRDPQILQGVIVDQATFLRLSSLRDPFGYFVAAAPGADGGEVVERVKAALRQFPTAETRSNADYRKLVDDQVNQMVYLLYALLAMSLVISLFGIANSLFLSIHERTREFGLLRSVGATQEQVRRVVRYESVITAVIGGLLGTVVGILFAGLATAALSDLGLGFTLPAGQLVLFLVLAVVVGIVGAAVPARRAARIQVLEAMHHE